MPRQPPITPLPGHGLRSSGLQGPYTVGHPDAHRLAHLSWFPPPSLQESKRGARNQEARRLLNQQPGDRVQAWTRREEVRLQGLRRGPRFLPVTPPGGLHGSGPVQRAGPLARAVPPPCHQPLLPSPSLEGGTKEAWPGQLGCRPDCNWKLLLPLIPQEGWELLVRGSSFESSR